MQIPNLQHDVGNEGDTEGLKKAKSILFSFFWEVKIGN